MRPQGAKGEPRIWLLIPKELALACFEAAKPSGLDWDDWAKAVLQAAALTGRTDPAQTATTRGRGEPGSGIGLLVRQGYYLPYRLLRYWGILDVRYSLSRN